MNQKSVFLKDRKNEKKKRVSVYSGISEVYLKVTLSPLSRT